MKKLWSKRWSYAKLSFMLDLGHQILMQRKIREPHDNLLYHFLFTCGRGSRVIHLEPKTNVVVCGEFYLFISPMASIIIFLAITRNFYHFL